PHTRGGGASVTRAEAGTWAAGPFGYLWRGSRASSPGEKAAAFDVLEKLVTCSNPPWGESRSFRLPNLKVNELAVLRDPGELLMKIGTEDLGQALLFHGAVLAGFGGYLIGDLRGDHGDAVFVPVEQIPRPHFHAVDIDGGADVIDRRPPVGDDQAAAVVVEPAQRVDLANVAQPAIRDQPERANALHGRGHHLTRVTREVDARWIAVVADDHHDWQRLHGVDRLI